MLSYYQSINYEDIFTSRGLQHKVLDGVEYSIFQEDWYYGIFVDNYSGFDSDDISKEIMDVESMIGTFEGLTLRINKETYQLESIEIDVSDAKLSVYVYIVWDKNKVDSSHKNFNVSLVNDWGLKCIYMSGI